MKFPYIIALAAFLFLITYDTSSNTLESFINPSTEKSNKQCCDDPTYMAANQRQCASQHFQGIQFANPSYGCPNITPKTELGAIIGR